MLANINIYIYKHYIVNNRRYNVVVYSFHDAFAKLSFRGASTSFRTCSQTHKLTLLWFDEYYRRLTIKKTAFIWHLWVQEEAGSGMLSTAMWKCEPWKDRQTKAKSTAFCAHEEHYTAKLLGHHLKSKGFPLVVQSKRPEVAALLLPLEVSYGFARQIHDPKSSLARAWYSHWQLECIKWPRGVNQNVIPWFVVRAVAQFLGHTVYRCGGFLSIFVHGYNGEYQIVSVPWGYLEKDLRQECASAFVSACNKQLV